MPASAFGFSLSFRMVHYMRNSHKPVFDGFLPAQPPGLRERIAQFVFRKAEFDEVSLNYIKEYSEKGNVVFASFQSSNISLFMFYMVLRRHGIKTPAIALDYNPFLLQPMKHLWRRLISSSRPCSSAAARSGTS